MEDENYLNLEYISAVQSRIFFFVTFLTNFLKRTIIILAYDALSCS
jgi:hypothetical protein